MENIVISKNNARSFLIKYQGLDCKNQSILEYFEKVGSIQYDPLNVVGKNADLVLQSRIKNYKSNDLLKLLYETRDLVDGWDKMMSIYKQKDWGYFEKVRQKRGEEIEHYLKRRNSIDALEHLDEIRDYIKLNGPTMSKEINIGSSNAGKWGHKRLSSVALDYLYNIGEIGVYTKKNTQKVYDLVENLLQENIYKAKTLFKNDDDFYEWYIERRIGSVGFIWERNSAAWLGNYISKSEIRKKAIKSLVEKGRIIKFYIENIKYHFYIKSKDMELLENSSVNKEMRFLAPLDNLLWDREMVKQIFDFEYTWEVYVPENKRKYGYYVLPVLFGNEFIARFEPEIYRNEKELRIKNWWFEEGIVLTQEMKEAIIIAFEEFCLYLGADNVNKADLKKILNG